MTYTDDQLTENVKNGALSAYEELFHRYQGKLYNFIYSLVGTTEAANDLTQQAFFNVYKTLPGLGALGFSAYLHRTARNLALDRLKDTKDVKEAKPPKRRKDQNIYADPQRSTVLDDQQAQVRKIAAELPETMRTALTLRELEGMTYGEIARVLEMPKKSVGILVTEGRTKFKEALRGTQADAGTLPAECDSIVPLLSSCLDQELSNARQDKVQSHLKACPACRRARKELKEASASYQSIVPLVPPGSLGEDLFKQVRGMGAHDRTVAPEPESATDSGQINKVETVELVDPEPGGKTRSRKLVTIGVPTLGAIIGGLFFGIYVLGGTPGNVKPVDSKSMIETFDANGGIQSPVAVIDEAREATLALEKDMATTDETETSATPTDSESGATSATPEASATPAVATTTEATETTAAQSGSTDPTQTAQPDNTAPPTPTGLSPAGGSVNTGANVTLYWTAVSDPSGVTYAIEIESQHPGQSWQDVKSLTGLTGINYKHSLGNFQERWRVWAVDGAGNPGPKSDWSLLRRKI